MERRKIDADGCRAVQRNKRVRKLAVVVVLQNLLVAACLAATLFVYWEAQGSTFEDVHIKFVTIGDKTKNGTLELGGTASRNNMELDVNNTIYTNCTGPYILYMDVCYKSMQEQQEATGTLELRVAGSKTPVYSVNLTASHEVCRGLQSIAYLKVKEGASLYLNCEDGFKIKNITVGLSYLLGRRCEF